MKKWWWICGGMVLIVCILLGTYFYSQPRVVNNWASNDKPIVLNNKVWKVVCSNEIDPLSVTEDHVYVINAKGERQSVSVSLSNDQKAIIVQPPENGYEMAAEYYTLHILDGIMATNGRQLQSNQSLSFVVKETLPSIGSKQELNAYFSKAIKEMKERRSFDSGSDASGEESANTEALSMDSAKSAENSNPDYSKTNNQVSGVDEADTVKTDGNYLYQVMDGRIIITKLIPANQMKVMKSITYKQPSFSPSQLFLYKEQMVVIGHSYEEIKSEKKASDRADLMIAPASSSMKAIVYDVSDRSNPVVIREVEMEGHYISARRINEYVYLVAQHHPNYWLLDKNEKIDLRPRVFDTSMSDEKKPINYTDIQYFPQSKETNYTIISSFNLEKPKADATFTTYLGSGRDMYMSKENLFLAVMSYPDIPFETRRDFSPDSTIYKFSIDEEKVTFEGSAEVPGTVLNQFSMDEHDGNFRIVTTKGQVWNDEQPSGNNLYIFDENLKQIGNLEDLARGERIYSARFMQDRIYVVTFKQVDPLFVIDASDPKNPSVLGELKIPGFSNYLHPYDENHLIGFGHDTKIVTGKGQEGEPRILTQGVKISLFDVSDVHNPKEKFSEIIGGRGTHSPVNHDHKALLVHKKRNLFAFPISVYENVEDGNHYEQNFIFQGAMVYNIDLKDGIQLEKKISHLEGNSPYEEWESTIRRMIYIEDNIYAISPTKISAHNMDSYKQIGEVTIRESSD
ncbi:beta-propeller domain-containing protein [Alkalihalobacillus sp. AL-G]|uniref:beta-propeller domain-containing protein n=1 Tax=Alkalihalobacillus sp. AL-G TaxID=2926399 RepID=UPI00272A0C59|nr:beta-propeller domain-containing protein [Alkalihalobacillus sp. AL-G]WLD91614.1 beta-propeller domain-containing protein [Alkalihalobacillus sp. AL-G]